MSRQLTIRGVPDDVIARLENVSRARDQEDQARLEDALRLDAEANAAFAREAGVAAARVWGQGSMTDPSDL
jgi:predicted transcriptional regulator